MSTSAEQELRQRLSAALDEMPPGPAPVGAVIRHGRTIRRRRVAGLAASALAAAAVVTAAGLLGLRLPSQAPVAPRPAVVTVVPPGPGAPAGQIASGTVGGARWSARVTEPRKGQTCLVASGETGRVCGLSTRALSPAEFEGGFSAHGYRIVGGPVQPRVTRVEVLLADGQRLVLHPAAVYGQRWVAVALPLRTGVIKAVAYHGRAVYRYAIPFSEPGPYSSPMFSDWLRPGSAGLPRRVIQLGSGTADGHRWSAIEYTGPWGRCLVVSGGSDCVHGDGPLMEAGNLTQEMFSVPGGVHLAVAAAGVASVELDISSGQQVRVTTRAGYGGERFYAFVLPHGTLLAGWTAYGPDGKVLGSGPGSGFE
jgi:hypothetical protein